MEENKNDNSYFRPLELLLIIIITIVLVAAAGFILILLNGATLSLLSEILIILPAALFVLLGKRPFRRNFRLNAVNMNILTSTLLLSLSLFVIGDEMDRLINSLFPMPDLLFESMKSLLTINSLTDGIVIILSGVIFAAIAEEMLFRGAIQRTLERHGDPAIAIVLSSVFFALIHFNPWSALQIMFLGLFLGYIAWKSDSIVPSMILHGLNNLVSILFINMPEESFTWYAGEKHVKFYWIILALSLLVPAIRLFNSACHEKNRISP